MGGRGRMVAAAGQRDPRKARAGAKGIPITKEKGHGSSNPTTALPPKPAPKHNSRSVHIDQHNSHRSERKVSKL